MDEPALIASLQRAVAAAPEDPTLRLHLADRLVEAGRTDEAIGHISMVLAAEAGSVPARALMARCLAAQPRAVEEAPEEGDAPRSDPTEFDWSRAESEVEHIAAPMFVSDAGPEPEVPLTTLNNLPCGLPTWVA